MPTRFSVALRAHNTTAISASSESTTAIGLVEFLNRRPLYTAELFAMYRYCKVRAVTINMQVINTYTTSPVPLQAAIGVIPYDQVSSVTMDRLLETRGSVKTIVSPPGGMDRASLSRKFNVAQEFGIQPFDKTYWMTDAQSISATPVDSAEPTIVLAVDNIPSSTATYSATIDWVITYHVDFFDLVAPPAS